MPDYDLGTARGRVVIDYSDKGTAKAGQDLGRLGSSTEDYGSAARSASKDSETLSRSMGKTGSAAASSQKSMDSLVATVMKYRGAMMAVAPAASFLARNLQSIQRAAGGGPGGIASAIALSSRGLKTFAGIGTRTLPQMVADFFGLRMAIRGVPEEMKTWPKFFQNAVRASAMMGAAGAAFGGISRAMGSLRLAPDALGGIAGKAQRLVRSLDNVTGSLSTKLTGATKVASKGLKGLWDTADGTLKGITKLSFGVVFAQRAMKSASKVYHTVAWGLERFTWAMGAAGLGSLALVKSLTGLSTVVRGTGNAIKQISGIALLVPGALFAIGAAAITAKIGMKGMGDAFKAAVDDEADLGEATKKLAGSAKDLVKQVREVKKGWSDLQKSVQQEMFKDTAERFRDLSDKYLPAMNDGMVKAAGGLNSFMQSFADFGGQDRTVEKINDAFKSTGTLLANAGRTMVPFLEGMREIGDTGIKALTDYSSVWEGYGKSFSAWSREAADSGKMRGWIDGSIDGIKDLGRITGNLGKVISNTFKPFKDGEVDNALERFAAKTQAWAQAMDVGGRGGNFMQGFKDHLDKMAVPWEEGLPKMIDKLKPAFEALLPVMERFSHIAAREAEVMLSILVPAITAVLKIIGSLGNEVGMLIMVLAALRSLNWLRKIGMYFAAPLIAAAASAMAFRGALRELNPALNNTRNAIGGVGRAATAIPLSPMAQKIQKFRGAFDSVALRAMYAGEAIKRFGSQFTPAGRNMSALGQTATRMNAQIGAISTAMPGFAGSLRNFAGATSLTRSNINSMTSRLAAMNGQVAATSRAFPALYAGMGAAGAGARDISTRLSTIPGPLARISTLMGQAGGAAKNFGGALQSGAGAAMGGVRSAASGLMGVMGGPWGVAFMAATVAAMDFAMTMKRTATANNDVQKAATAAASAQRELVAAVASTKPGEDRSAVTTAGMKIVQAEIDKTNATAEKSKGIFNGLANTIDNLSGVSYSGFKKAAEGANNSLDRNRYEGNMARREQEALGNALRETGYTMEEATKAATTGGPAWETITAALNRTGDAGIAMGAKMQNGAAGIAAAEAYVGKVGTKYAQIESAMAVLGDSAATAEQRVSALNSVLISMGLLEGNSAQAAKNIAQSLNELAEAAGSTSQAADQFGNEFQNLDGSLNLANVNTHNLHGLLTGLRTEMQNIPAGEMAAKFDSMQPSLEAARQQLGMTKEEFQAILVQIGLTPESVSMEIQLKGAEAVGLNLTNILDKLKTVEPGTTIPVKIESQDAFNALDEAGVKILEWNKETGVATISAENSEALAKVQGAIDKKNEFANSQVGKPKLDVDASAVAPKVEGAKADVGSLNSIVGTAKLDAADAPVLPKVEGAKANVNSLDSVKGTATLDANGQPVPPKVEAARSSISSLDLARGEGTLDVDGTAIPPKVADSTADIWGLNSVLGMGRIDVDNSAVGPKVGWAQSMIDSIRGKTVFIDVVMNAPLPSAGPLPGLPGSASGGRFDGTGRKLPGYARGKRHKGYQLPSTGPGTNVTDGFLAFDGFGAPAAWLDKNEWVINGKSSKKYSRLLSAINRDDPRLKALPQFAGGMDGAKAQAAQLGKSVHTVTQQIGMIVNEQEIERVSAFMAQISSDEFAEKFGKGAVDGLTLGSRDYFVDQGKQYADALGLVFGKAAQDANDRLKEEIDKIEDKNLKEQREKTLKSTEELQAIADAEMMAWVNNNQFEAMGYTMAKSFADGVAGGQNLVSAGVGALGTAATMALSAAGAPGIVAGLAVQAISGLVDAFSDPALWDDGIGPGIYKIIDKMLGGLVTVILDVVRNLFKMIGIDLAKVPIIGFLFGIKDAANGASKEVDKLMTDLEALNKLEYKNLGKTGATTIDAAIESQLGNRALVSQVAPAGAPGASGPSIGTLNVHAPDDKASSIIEAATFQMKRY